MRGVRGGTTREEPFAGPGAGPRAPAVETPLVRLLTSLASGSLRGLRPCGWLRGALACALLVLTLGCASDLVSVEGGFRHREHGYTFGAPGGPGGPWERFDADDALIAFRRPGPQAIAVQSRCGKPVADVAIMARQLMIGTSPRTLRQAGPVLVDGRSGWTRTFDTLEDGVGARVKTVTLVLGRCTLDWILMAAGSRPFEEVERAFDAWWQAFRLPPEADPVERDG